MEYTDFSTLRSTAKKQQAIDKRNWILGAVKDRTVLDLGIVDHDIEESLRHPEKWLHGAIVENAKHVVGVDILEDAIQRLRGEGFNVLAADALELRLDERFDVVVCGDLIEHVASPLALLETISYHLNDDGQAYISTPNPFAIGRAFQVLFEGWTGVNSEHVCWICPQTMFQLVERSDLSISRLEWLITDYPATLTRRGFGRLGNFVRARAQERNRFLSDDFGVELRRRR